MPTDCIRTYQKVGVRIIWTLTNVAYTPVVPLLPVPPYLGLAFDQIFVEFSSRIYTV